MKQGHMATDRYLVLEILAWFYGMDPLHKAPRTDVCGSGALMRIHGLPCATRIGRCCLRASFLFLMS